MWNVCVQHWVCACEWTQCRLAFLRAPVAFDSQLLPCVFSFANRLFLRRLINSCGEKIMALLCGVRRVRVFEEAPFFRHVDGRSTSAKHVPGELLLFFARECDLDTASCLWWRYTLADCPEMAGTALQLNIWSWVQSLGVFSWLWCLPSWCVKAQATDQLMLRKHLWHLRAVVYRAASLPFPDGLY